MSNVPTLATRPTRWAKQRWKWDCRTRLNPTQVPHGARTLAGRGAHHISPTKPFSLFGETLGIARHAEWPQDVDKVAHGAKSAAISRSPAGLRIT